MRAALTKKDEEGTWCPVAISKLDSFLGKAIKRGCGFRNTYALRRNIAYNLQYLEFLDRVLSDVKLTSVLTTQTYKAFILFGCGIVESLLTFLLIKSDNYRTTEWELECVMQGQPKKVHGQWKRVDSYLHLKLASPVQEEMTFDAMLKKAERKHLLGAHHSVYAKLSSLRPLRNRVHIQMIQNSTDTDWNAFQYADQCTMASVIRDIFTGSVFRPSNEERSLFSYLDKYA